MPAIYKPLQTSLLHLFVSVFSLDHALTYNNNNNNNSNYNNNNNSSFIIQDDNFHSIYVPTISRAILGRHAGMWMFKERTDSVITKVQKYKLPIDFEINFVAAVDQQKHSS